MVVTILQIMETWPLHLVLQTPTGNIHVGLAEDVILKRGEAFVGPSTLKPGQRVRVLKRKTNGSIAELEICD